MLGSRDPTIDSPGIGRLPLLEGAGDEHGGRSVRTEGDVRDVGSRDIDRADKLAVLTHNKDSAGTVLRNVIAAVGAEFHAIRAVVGILVRCRRRKILQARPDGPRAKLAVGSDGKGEDTSR